MSYENKDSIISDISYTNDLIENNNGAERLAELDEVYAKAKAFDEVFNEYSAESYQHLESVGEMFSVFGERAAAILHAYESERES